MANGGSACYRLRPHHLYNLATGHENGYANLRDALRTAKVGVNGNEREAYTEKDAISHPDFYLKLASDPKNTIEIVEGSDDFCGICSNYDGSGCSLFSEQELKTEDERALVSLSVLLVDGWRLKAGNKIRASDLTKPLRDYGDALPFTTDSGLFPEV